MKAEELDKKFDAGEDITRYLDLSQARRPEQELVSVEQVKKYYRKMIK